MTDRPLRHLRLLLFVPLALWALAACGPREDTTPQTQPQDAPGVTTTPDPAPEAVPPAGADPLMTEPAPAEPAEAEVAEEPVEEMEEAEEAAEEALEADVVITMENDGNEAWVATSVDGEQNVANLDEENPTLRLSVGNRYRIETLADEHPLELHDADGNVLLALGGAGTLANDPEVAYAEDASGVSFTLTQALADQLAGYRCAIHPEMAGEIEISQAE